MSDSHSIVAGPAPSLRSGLLLAGALTYGGALWLQVLHRVADREPIGVQALVTGGIATALLALPVAVVLVLAVLRWSDYAGHGRGMRAALAGWAGAIALVLSAPIQALVTGASLAPALSPAALLGDLAAGLLVTMPLAAVTLLAIQRWRHRERTTRRSVFAFLSTVTVCLSLLTVGQVAAAAAPVATLAGCLSGSGPVVKFAVTAINVNIPLNRFGDHDPKGKMYAPNYQLAAIKAQALSQQVSIGLRDDPIQPLVIRANEGDCVAVTYKNLATGGNFGMHIDGLAFNASSSGDAVGANTPSGPAKSGTATYRFYIPNDPTLEGSHYIHPGPGYRAAVDHGLFGSLIVEPPGSTYWNASTPNKPLLSGWEAIIRPGGEAASCNPALRNCAFREGALLHHEVGNDNEVIMAATGEPQPQVDNLTGSYRPGAFAINYRSEPFRNRLMDFPLEHAHSYSSYTFGDPATPMMRGYLGDPTKLRIVHAGGEKFHVFHLHGGGDRWRLNPVADTTGDYAQTGLQKDPATTLSPSQRMDSQSIGPGESFNAEIEGGAGGVQQSAGDFLYHCHIAKHYVSGMWAFWRVYNTLQSDLVPLVDRAPLAAAVDSTALIGTTVHQGPGDPGTLITAANLSQWLKPQLPPAGVRKPGTEYGSNGAVMDWTTATTDPTLVLGEPDDKTAFPDSAKLSATSPNLLAADLAYPQPLVENRPRILFDPTTGRPAHPILRTHVGKRPPFSPNGHSGAPFLGEDAGTAPTSATDALANRADGLCPSGRPVDRFNVVAISLAIQRTATAVDPDGKIFVLAHDKDAVLAGDGNVTPLAIRMNQGDCGAITLTNEIPDAKAFDKFSKVEMHIHHVQFDVQGSDGVSTGFAWEHSVRPYKVEDPQLTADAHHDDTQITLTNVDKFVDVDAHGNPSQMWIAVGEGTENIDIVQIASVNTATKTLTLSTPLKKDHDAAEWAGIEFIQYRWYPDVVLDNIFWHDHVDGIHGWGHGLLGQLIVEPFGSTYHDPKTGDPVDSGTLVDIHTSNPLAPGVVDGSFRELALWQNDDNDQADFATLNLKAAPFLDRPDAANRFSSYKYGDPFTPLPRMYPSDPLVIRTIAVSPTIDTLHVQGGRFLNENRYVDAYGPESSINDTIHYMISERYTLIVNGQQPGLRQQPGDYLYFNGIQKKMEQGAWGIMRILSGKVPDLKPLPDIGDPHDDWVQPVQTGGAPPPANGPGNPCPVGAPARNFDIAAVDVSGGGTARAVYVPNADALAVKRGEKQPEPLTLHVAAGECVTVHVTNQRAVPTSFSVSKLDRTAGSGGVNVGWTPDQNIAVGGTRDYVYYVDSAKLGLAPIADFASAGSAKLGLYGSLVVSPQSTVPGQLTYFTDPVTGGPLDIGTQVLVHVPGAATPDYRDFTVVMADDDARMGQDLMPYPTNARLGKSLMNYKFAPAGDGPTAFQNPGTVPFLTAYQGDPMVVHTMLAPGSENSHVFSLGGLSWPTDSNIPESNVVSAQGMGPWDSIEAHIIGGAGGVAQSPGDYFYGDLRRPFTQVGLWGLQRVLPTPFNVCPIRRVDNTTCF